MPVKVIQFWEEQVYYHSVQKNEKLFAQAFPYYLLYATYYMLLIVKYAKFQMLVVVYRVYWYKK